MKLKLLFLLLSAQFINILGETTVAPDVITTPGSGVPASVNDPATTTETSATTAGTDALTNSNQDSSSSTGGATSDQGDSSSTADSGSNQAGSQTDGTTSFSSGAGDTPAEGSQGGDTSTGEVSFVLTDEVKALLNSYNVSLATVMQLFPQVNQAGNDSISLPTNAEGEKTGSVKDAPGTVPEDVSNKFKELNAELAKINAEENRLKGVNEDITRSEFTKGQMLILNLQKIIITSKLEELTTKHPALISVSTEPQGRRQIGRSITMTQSSNDIPNNIPDNVYKTYKEEIQKLRDTNLKEQAIITAELNGQILMSTAAREKQILLLEKQRIQSKLIPILNKYPSLRLALRREQRLRQLSEWEDNSSFNEFVRKSQLAYDYVSKVLRDSQRDNMRKLASLNSPSFSQRIPTEASVSNTERLRNVLSLPDYVRVPDLESESKPLSGTVSGENSPVTSNIGGLPMTTGNQDGRRINNAARVSSMSDQRFWAVPRRVGLLPPSISNTRFRRYRYPFF